MTDTTTAAPAVNFLDDTDVPAPESKALAANPFVGKIETLIPTMGTEHPKAGAVLVPAAQVGTISRQIILAGNAHKVTMRQKRTEQPDGSVKIVFYPVPKITRPRKPAADASAVADAPAESDAPAAAEPVADAAPKARGKR